MIPDRFYIVSTLIILHGLVVQCRRKNREDAHPYLQLSREDIDGNLLRQRCYVSCTFEKDCTCRKNLSEFTKKPGLCPNSTNSILEKICLDECKEGNDYECPGTKVCCKQDCGYSCQDAAGLDTNPDLPPIPFNVSVSEHHCNAKKCEISWKIHRNQFDILPVVYVVETRSHVGNVFSHRKLGKWQWCVFGKRGESVDHELMIMKTTATIELNMGQWYQIRVAAINKYGFRGYSNYSHEYRLNDQNPDAEPKAPKSPRNLNVATVGYWPNGTVRAKVNWKRPPSDLPIDRYTVTWSLFLNDSSSLYQNEDYIKEPPYELFDLRKDSFYYVQVQAISISAGKRLKSSKQSMLLNTTTDKLLSLNTKGATIMPIQDEREIRFKFLPNRKYGMLVHVYSDRSDRSFTGSFVELCSGKCDCESKEYGAVRPRKKEIIFSRLKFNTEYTLHVIYRIPVKVQEITKTFRTPLCENFKKTHPNLRTKC